jgi:hypothetical protein
VKILDAALIMEKVITNASFVLTTSALYRKPLGEI